MEGSVPLPNEVWWPGSPAGLGKLLNEFQGLRFRDMILAVLRVSQAESCRLARYCKICGRNEHRQ